MYSFLVFCLIFGLSAAREEAYACNDTNEYPNLAKGWKKVADQYCEYLDDSQSDNIAKCINDTKIPLMDAINKCQKDFNQPNVTFVEFLRNICQSKDDMIDYFCCLTDYILKAGADKQSVERSSKYTKCLDKYLIKDN